MDSPMIIIIDLTPLGKFICKASMCNPQVAKMRYIYALSIYNNQRCVLFSSFPPNSYYVSAVILSICVQSSTKVLSILRGVFQFFSEQIFNIVYFINSSLKMNEAQCLYDGCPLWLLFHKIIDIHTSHQMHI